MGWWYKLNIIQSLVILSSGKGSNACTVFLLIPFAIFMRLTMDKSFLYNKIQATDFCELWIWHGLKLSIARANQT